MVSRVAKNPIEIPTSVEVKLVGQEIIVKGKLGQLSQQVPAVVKVTQTDNVLQFNPANGDQESNALAGTSRALVSNMVHGVSEGFQRELVMVGVGYRAKAQGKTLNLTVGLSHPVNITMPDDITVETPSATEIVLKGPNKQKVCQIAANIRAVRPPEPYKGKGIRYKDEHIVRKEAKKK
ncbi:50S ribosomal protein L6 [Candidiatus Paracoxiella cheracis]|uniref:50S ribosomal protein L6 n=1 Tax=Candidiatus Paracoxiella cheracis TaxID=3405120 RepID=UPI003BF50B15